MAGESSKGPSLVVDFVRANYAIAALAVGTIAIEPARVWVVSHLSFVGIGLALLETAILAYLLLRGRDSNSSGPSAVFSETDVTRDRLEIRFGTEADFACTEKVYHEWFRPSLSVKDEEYLALMRRGNLMRVVEATLSAGPEVSKTIVGFYDIWPLSEDMFEKLSSGKTRERDFTANMILDLSDESVSTLYVPEICVSKNWDVGALLVRDLMRYLGNILEAHSNVKRVAAWPYTAYGRRLILGFKMVRGRWRPFGKSIYEISSSRVQGLPKPKGPFKKKWSINY